MDVSDLNDDQLYDQKKTHKLQDKYYVKFAWGSSNLCFLIIS